MIAAFTVWNSRIAPVFDVARQVIILEGDATGDGQIVSLDNCSPQEKIRRLEEAGVNQLICGAISRPLCRLAQSRGIQVLPFVTGDQSDVVEAWKKGCLQEGAFAMPGCGRRRKRRGGCQRNGADFNLPPEKMKPCKTPGKGEKLCLDMTRQDPWGKAL